ncbi:uridine kinase [Inquilinus sp. NPDC058860]|uniref:uridine kinase family protein n=1 Tax=Inquilinus sp. NPDC058860 TaxID=3346652 RepID=UPI0036858FC1
MQAIDLRAMILEKLIAHMSSAKRLAIAGAGCTGKSTFASELADRLRREGIDATVFELDSYFMPRAERARAGLSAYHPSAFGLAQARRDIDLLLEGHDVPIRTYDKVTGTSHDAGVLRLGDCLIIEGAMALHDTLLGTTPLCMFLDASRQTLFENRRRREEGLGFGYEEIVRKFIGLEADYAKHIAPQGRHAHLCVEIDEQYRFKKLEARSS